LSHPGPYNNIEIGFNTYLLSDLLSVLGVCVKTCGSRRVVLGRTTSDANHDIQIVIE